MADSATTNHNFALPEVGASKDSWGTKLNSNFEQLDALLRVGSGTFVRRAGDTMTGMLTLPVTAPTAGTHAANKSYVDTTIATNVANLNNALVPKTRTLTGGSGITTVIGDLSANRTISVDNTVVRTSGDQTVGGSKTFTAETTFTSPVTATSWVRLNMPGAAGEATKELFYNGANGIIGFYDRTNNRWDLQVDTDGNLVPRGSVDAAKLSGTIADARVPASIVRTSRVIAAGDGLTGGGNLSADRPLALGTPSAITATSTNSVTGTSHTHSLSAAAVQTLLANGGVGQVGTYAILRRTAPGAAVPGNNYAASDFDGYGSGGGSDFSGTPTGTWKCMGYVKPGESFERSTLFLRIS